MARGYLLTAGATVAVCLTASLFAASREAELAEAVKQGNHAAVRAMLKRSVFVNATEADGTTALHWAVRADDLETVRLLLTAGAVVDARNRYGVTPLWLAATNGNAKMIQVLLESGADSNTAMPEGETVLMTAARTGSADAVRVLAARGANVNAKERWLGETALMWAASENHVSAVKALVELGADLNARSAPSTFPRASPPAENLITMTFPQGGWTPLMYASRQGALQSARVLADRGADLDATNGDGMTSTTVAIINGHYDIAGMLLEHGANPNVADVAGMTPLYAAIDMRTLPWMQGRPAPRPTGQLDGLELITQLLAAGADPNARLKQALLQRQHTVGDPLLKDGTTPFIRAARFGDATVMRVLLEHGANPHLTQKNHTTALMIAAGLGTDHTTDEFFQDKGTEVDAIEAIKVCLEQRVDINGFNDSGDTALHRATGESIIRFLVAHGADLTFQNKQRKTPLEVTLERKDRNGAIRYPRAVTALRELTEVRSVSTSAPFADR
jgi:ankyrin repeat protein